MSVTILLLEARETAHGTLRIGGQLGLRTGIDVVSRREYPLPFAAGNLTLAFQSIAYFKIYKTEVEFSGNYFVRGYPGIILCRPKKNNVIIILDFHTLYQIFRSRFSSEV
jgi:hypothetical protein